MSLRASRALTQKLRIGQGGDRAIASDAAARAERARAEKRTALSERHRCEPTSVPTARGSVVRFAAAAGANAPELERIKLATSEAVTNAVLYAYQGRTGEIHVDAWVAGDELWLFVADDGCGMTAGRGSIGLGRGLALISQVSNGFTIARRSSGGTELQLRFDLEKRTRAAKIRRARGSHNLSHDR